MPLHVLSGRAIQEQVVHVGLTAASVPTAEWQLAAGPAHR